MDIYNASAAGVGYIATYDPCSKTVTKLAASGFKSPRGLSPFCMDVVPSTHNPLEFTIYLINMRPPFVDLDEDLPPGIRDEIASARAKQKGPDPSIEVFRYVLGSDSMQHVATWEDEDAVIFPADIVGLPDMEGFWFTNGYPCRAGGVRHSPEVFSTAGADSLPLEISRNVPGRIFNKTRFRLGSAESMNANSLQPGLMVPMESQDLRSTLMTPSTSAANGLVV